MREIDSFAAPREWRGVRWVNVQGEVPPGIRSAYNEQEVQAVMQLLDQWHEEGPLTQEELSTGIVTPFRAQMERIQEALRRQSWWGKMHQMADRPITVGTVHRFQGDERDLMIFSPVVATGMRERTKRWVARTDQLLNAAVTRARASLQIVGDLAHCRRAGGALVQLAEYVTQHSHVEAKS